MSTNAFSVNSNNFLMISKGRISEIRKLHLKKFRDQEKLFLVEGRKSVEMLLESDFQICDIYATENFYQEHQGMFGKMAVTMVSLPEMERISTLSTPPELLAVVRQRQNAQPIGEHEPVLVLDRIADPGNLGTMVRTADWFGIRHVVCSPDCVEFYNPKTIQSTMGSFCHVQVHVRDLVDFLKVNNDRRALGTFLGGESINEFEFHDNDIIVIGSESNGISAPVAECITHRITIPRGRTNGPSAESLNAAVAAAIVMERWSDR